jgi:cytochrome P450
MATSARPVALITGASAGIGAGIHFCLGHQLARMEGKCALQALLQRWPKLELATEEWRIRWRTRAGFRAIERLPVMTRPLT